MNAEPLHEGVTAGISQLPEPRTAVHSRAMKSVHQFSRRAFAAAGLAAGAVLALPSAAFAGLGVPGFRTQPWFAETTFDLGKDLAAAKEAGKTLVLLWEQEGCGYCRQMHAQAFQQPELIDLGIQQFHVVQMDMHGKRKFTDFSGAAVDESKLARTLRVTGTPTTLFYDAAAKEVFRMPGYAQPKIFFLIYQYVAEKGYLTAKLEDWAAKKYGQ
jgi:thioredoxin-related protein